MTSAERLPGRVLGTLGSPNTSAVCWSSTAPSLTRVAVRPPVAASMAMARLPLVSCSGEAEEDAVVEGGGEGSSAMIGGSLKGFPGPMI